MSEQKEQEVSSLEENSLRCSLEYSANTPLWQRVPTKDSSGQYLGDFMMIIPSLKKASSADKKDTLNRISQVLARYSDTVVFADLNMKMSLLWISIKPVKGMMLEIPTAIIESFPDAKLISDRPPQSR